MRGGLLIVDKAPGMTSHDVVGRVRRILSERRVGHGGTLDPMATGVLPVLVGRATRAAEYLLGDKAYEAEFTVGLTTDSYDTTGTITATRARRPSAEEMEAVLPAFRGALWQLPPMISAVRVGGKKLYEYARQGKEIERAPRPVTVHSLTVRPLGGDIWALSARCSKGTYVRSLIHDIGQALGCGAAMSALRRTYAEPFSLADAHTLEALAALAAAGEPPFVPVDRLFETYPAITLSPAQETLCYHGASIPWETELSGFCRVYGPDGAFLELGRAEQRDGRQLILPEKSFFEVTNP